MNMNNYAAITGIVTSLSMNSDTYNKRPIAQLSVYNAELQEWATRVLVLFPSDVLAKKSKKLVEGDIISVFGFLDNKNESNIIVCESLVVLSKNTNKESEFFRRADLGRYDTTPNKVIFIGDVVAKTDTSIFIRSNVQSVVYGELSKFPCIKATCQTQAQAKDVVFFTGNFGPDGLEGYAEIIKKK